MRKNSIKGKVFFGLFFVISIIASFFFTGLIMKVAPAGIERFKQMIFFSLVLIIGGSLSVIAGKIGGKK